MKTGRYSMSFTTGALFHRESVNMAVLYLELHDWNSVRDTALSKNLLQARTMNTAKRVCNEICSRLKTLEQRELNLLVNGTAQEQGYLLWLAICHRYQFIADFAVEIIHEHYISLNLNLHYDDFDSFFNKKAEWHPEMDTLTHTTKIKLRQVVFKMLREAGLFLQDTTINAAILTPQFLEALHNQKDIILFPVFDSVIKRCC